LHKEKPDRKKKVQCPPAKSYYLNFQLSSDGIPSLLPELIFGRRKDAQISNNTYTVKTVYFSGQEAKPN
jgi:hypothetical protein